jgi:hypothetical protein
VSFFKPNLSRSSQNKKPLSKIFSLVAAQRLEGIEQERLIGLMRYIRESLEQA